MITGLVKTLNEIKDQHFMIIQAQKDGKERVRKNDRMHIDTFIMQICKDKLANSKWEDNKLLLEFKDDRVNDHWEVVQTVKKIEHNFKDNRLEEVENRFIPRTEALQILERINCTGFIDQVGVIEKINMIDSGYIHYILKTADGKVLAKVNDYKREAV